MTLVEFFYVKSSFCMILKRPCEITVKTRHDASPQDKDAVAEVMILPRTRMSEGVVPRAVKDGGGHGPAADKDAVVEAVVQPRTRIAEALVPPQTWMTEVMVPLRTKTR